MDNRTFTLLDFDRVKEIIAQNTQTVFGYEQVLAIKPKDNIDEIENEFDLIQESFNLKSDISLSNIVDLRSYLTNIGDNTVLSGSVIKDVQLTLNNIHKIVETLTKQKDKCAKLYHLVKNIKTHVSLENNINQTIDEFGEVKTDASVRLKKIRHKITEKRKDIIKQLESIAAEYQAYLQDNNIVVKNNRYCLPLKVESQNKIAGILHEYSAAGRTVFIEPIALVNHQNELAQLSDEEKDEIQKILAQLSKQIFEVKNDILSSYDIIGKIDCVLAKKQFALKFNCQRPKISMDNKLCIRNGIHPLLTLTKKEVVPLNLEWPANTKVVLISGPNAGGKTVVLKTVGLFALMSLAGIYLPVAKGTEMPFFAKIFADIGDEQSMDNELSSFTAHLLRIKDILQNADQHSLVLIDEIGASTAPEEGSALAIAILEEIRDKGAFCLATSHLNPLKIFVNDAEGMINAAMEYTDRPTYRFIVGFPGMSSALEISKTIGLPNQLIERARKFLDQDLLKLSERLKSLAAETTKAVAMQEKLTEQQQQLQKLIFEYESKLKSFKQLERTEQQKIINEKRRFFIEQRRHIENLIRQIKETNASRETIIAAKRHLEQELNNLQHEQTEIPSLAQQTTDNFQIGDIVYSKTFQKSGKVVDKNKNTLSIAFGSIKMKLPPSDLEKSEKELGNIDTNKKINYDMINTFQPSLNIIGQTTWEANESISKFFEDAVSNDIYEVKIIHGKGALREMLWNSLAKNSRVESYHFGEPYEGGTGVTKITLKRNNL
ncbi:MAG: endonuclease MutS2 [candidate division WOR-3 bacterium]